MASHVPHHTHDPSIIQGSLNSWLRSLRFKKGLSSICKATYWPAMRILYNQLVIRRMDQILALSNTLRTSDISKVLVRFIKTLELDSCIVPASHADVVRENLAWILSHCMEIQTVSFIPHLNFPLLDVIPDHGETDQDCYNPSWLIHSSDPSRKPLLAEPLASRLRSLNLCLDVHNEAILHSAHRLLQDAPSLSSLSLSHFGGEWPAREWFPIKLPESLLCLPSLSELKVDFGERPELQEYISSCWDLPALTRLTIVQAKDERRRGDPLAFLERFGKRLTYLHIFRTPQPGPLVGHNMRYHLAYFLYQLCPVIEHLVIPEAAGRNLVMQSPTLRWLDAWVIESPPGFLLPQHTILLSYTSSVPALRGKRLLVPPEDGMTLNPITTGEVDWPEVCAPDLLVQDTPWFGDNPYIVHRFPTRWVVQTAMFVVAFDRAEMDDVIKLLAGQHTDTTEEYMAVMNRSSMNDEMQNWDTGEGSQDEDGSDEVGWSEVSTDTEGSSEYWSDEEEE